MPRPVSAKITAILTELRGRLTSGYLSPGDAFFSNRALAQKFEISYQTAHRILENLSREGLISRQQGAGSIVAGQIPALSAVCLVFHSRADRPETFGYYLRERLETELNTRGIRHQLLHPDSLDKIEPDQYPLFWNLDPIPQAFLQLRRHCLVVNNRPSLGLSARWVDSVSVDDFAGGLMAGEVLREHFDCRRIAVVGGPTNDYRSQERIRGCSSAFPRLVQHSAGTWGQKIPKALFRTIANEPVEGIFCVNDRIAVRIRDETPWKRPPPAIVGFDNTPTAQRHHLSTIAIPWDLFVSTIVDTTERRLKGDHRPAVDQILRMEPIIRNDPKAVRKPAP